MYVLKYVSPPCTSRVYHLYGKRLGNKDIKGHFEIRILIEKLFLLSILLQCLDSVLNFHPIGSNFNMSSMT